MSKEQEVNTPYHIQPHNDCVVFDDKGNSVIQTATPEHANFIVTACNSHYALKKENEELRATVGEVDVTESKLEEYADNYVAQYLPHVDTTGHWLGFQDGYKKAIQDIKISLIKAGITI